MIEDDATTSGLSWAPIPASVPPPASGITAAMVGVLEAMQDVIDAAAAYRVRCVDAGFSPDVAEHMAGQFHEYVIKMALHSFATGGGKK